MTGVRRTKVAKPRADHEGSIYQRADGKWIAEVSAGWADGARKRRKRVCGSEAEAVAALKVLHRILDEGATVAAEKLTVEAWLREWLQKEARPSVRPRTFASYQTIVDRHLVPRLGAHRLRKLDSRHVRDFMAAERAAGLSARSVQYHHAILRRALRVAESHGLVSRNVTRLVTPPKIERPEVRPLSQEEAVAFLVSVRGHRLEALFITAMATGLRQSEVLGLTWGDLDLEGAAVRVNRSLQRYDGAYHLDAPKTARSRRTVALPAGAVDALRAHSVRQKAERLKAGPVWQGDRWNLVFAAEEGGPLYGIQVTRQFQRLLAAAGLPRERFHDLRHGAATFLLSAGVDLRTVMDVLGHSTIATTANTYSHVMPALRRDAAERIGRTLFG